MPDTIPRSSRVSEPTLWRASKPTSMVSSCLLYQTYFARKHCFVAILDLLIPGRTPGIKTEVVDLYGKPEILFFGPDGMSFTIPHICPDTKLMMCTVS